MWSFDEQQKIKRLYTKINIDESEVGKFFDPLEWYAIAASGQARNVANTKNWFRVPRKQNNFSLARFQYLIFDDQNSTDGTGTDRWRRHFKKCIRALEFRPDSSKVVSISFSLLTRDPIKAANNEPTAYSYVSFVICIMYY